MKKTFILALLSALPLFVLSQFTMYRSTHSPAAGDVIYRTWYDTTGVSPGPAGQANLWDYSSVGNVLRSDTVRYLATPTGNPDCPSLLGANVAEEVSSYFINMNQPTLHYNFLQSIPGKLSYEGYCIPQTADAGPADFSDPAQVMAFPMTYGGSFSDYYHGTFYGFATLSFSGNIYGELDAKGDLVLPNGDTVFNVMRLHLVDSASTGGGNLYNLWTEAWLYFAQTSRSPVFGIRQRTYFKEVFSNENLLLVGQAEPEVKSGLSLVPNPAQDRTVLKFYVDRAQSLQLEVFDLAGRRVHSAILQAHGAGPQAYPLRTDGWAAGLYRISLRGEGQLLGSESLIIRP